MMKSVLQGRRNTAAKRAKALRPAHKPRGSYETEKLESRVLLSTGQILVVTGETIGEYNTTGATVKASLISGLTGGVNGIAVSGSDVFVPSVNGIPDEPGSVGEYTTSGQTVNSALISNLDTPEGVAISGGDLFVSDELTGSVSEYTTAGATVNSEIIGGLTSVIGSQPLSIAISGGDLFVLTSQTNGTNGAVGTIQEYTVGGVPLNTALITGFSASQPEGFTVNGSDLYLVNHAAGTVSEYTTSGQLVNGSFISGLNNPVGITLFDNDIYVMNNGNGTIGEYTLAGAAVNTAVVSGISNGTWIAMETAPGASAQLAFAATPSLVVAGQSFTSPVIVDVEDANGNVQTGDTSAVTLSVFSGPTGGTLVGTTTVAAEGGQATFNTLQLTRGGNYVLKASDGALTTAASNSIDAIVGWIDQANLDVISGWAYNPSNPSVSVGIEIDIMGGPIQQITANQQRADLLPVVGSQLVGFEYSTPMMTTGSHQVYIYAEEPGVGNVLLGQTTLVSQNGLFDTHYYDENNPQVVQEVQDGFYATAYDQFLAVGQYQMQANPNAEPSPYWNEQYYLSVNPDVADAVELGTVSSGFMHYYLYGQYENRFGLEWFSPDFYLAENTDVATAIQNGTITSAFEHFCDFGQYEGRDPIGQIIMGQPVSYFQTALYEESNTDILNYITGEPYSSAYEQFVETGLSDTGVAGSGTMAVQTGRFWTLNWSAVLYYNYQAGALGSVGESNVEGLFENFLEWGEYLGYYAGQPGLTPP
jgi:hypothetical protein